MITRGSGNSRNRCPHQPPSSYPPESPTPPDCEKLKSWYRRLSKNRVRCVVGVRTRDNDELAGETSTQKSRNPTNRCPISPPRFIPPGDPQVAKPGIFYSLGMSSIGKSHQICRADAHAQFCQRGEQCHSHRISKNPKIPNW